jgi:hypothetical protein
MITISSVFCQFSAEKNGLFLLKNVIIPCLQNLAAFRVKNAYFSPVLLQKYLLHHNIGPGLSSSEYKSKRFVYIYIHSTRYIHLMGRTWIPRRWPSQSRLVVYIPKAFLVLVAQHRYFWGPWNEKCRYILRTFGICVLIWWYTYFYGHLVYFPPYWYVLPKKSGDPGLHNPTFLRRNFKK